jgi:DNA-binding transcriptional LysR family regulator
MDLPWADLELFLAVAETRSFSAGARKLGVTQPTVSRRIAALEESLGRALFQRNVEGARLTAEGERLLPAAEQMARWAAEVSRSIASWSETVEGVVRIATPPGLAFDLLVPFARDLRDRLPGVRLELLTGIEHVDLSRGQADIAVRTRRPAQPDLEVVLALQAELGVFVSPAYARRRCAASSPRSLAELDWITWSYPNEHLPPRPELERLIPNFRPAFASNDYLAQERALALGLGAMILSRTHHPDRFTGPLEEVLVDLPLPKATFYVVCAKTMRWVPRVQAVLEELRAKLLAVQGVAEAS